LAPSRLGVNNSGLPGPGIIGETEFVMLRRVQPGEPISAALYNALVDAVNRLLNVTGSFPIEVRRHPAGVHVSLAYAEREAVVELQTALAPASTATGQILWRDSAAWLPGDTAAIDVEDPLGNMAGVPGDRLLARFHRQSGRWLVWQPYGLIRRGTLDVALHPGGSVPCSLLTGPPGSEFDSGENLTVHDGLLLADDEPIEALTRVFVALAHGAWWVIAASCPAGPPSGGS
jgi:hypothetical protein